MSGLTQNQFKSAGVYGVLQVLDLSGSTPVNASFS
jgi:hypothetical protein